MRVDAPLSVMEFQAVVMAAGQGSRMTDLTTSVPKPLLPIGNKPMIWYPLNLLERTGFEEVIVVTTKDVKAQLLGQASLNTRLRLDIVCIPEEADMGTADSLRFIHSRIKRDVIVLSCDLITDVSLHQLFDLFRLRDAAVVMMARRAQDSGEPVPGQKGKRKPEQRDLIAVDESGERLLLVSHEADLEEELLIPRAVARRFARIHIKWELEDVHAYCLRKWVLDFLEDNKPVPPSTRSSISTIKEELVPYLVRKQFSRAPRRSAGLQDDDGADRPVCGQKDVHDYVGEDPMQALARDKSSFRGTGDRLRCYLLEAPAGSLCMRANSLASYIEANKQVPKVLPSLILGADEPMISPCATLGDKSQVGSESMIGHETTLAERTSVKRSVVGEVCTIGERCKIANSILMHRVTVQEGCTLTGCVVCEGAVIEKGAELKDCLVGSQVLVEARAKRTNEVIVNSEQMMEI